MEQLAGMVKNRNIVQVSYGDELVLQMMWLVRICLPFLLGGCAYFVSWDDIAQGWIGKSIDRYISMHGEPSSVKRLADGHQEYKFLFPEVSRSCTQYWIVDQQSVMKRGWHKGYCRVM
ncbi:MAG: hypothetical protein M9951_07290 [Burkholderiaceae bacterium]|nr:hypothetical protein [Burkholderiaceae bacterium]